jgi:hypothetical protein
VDADEFDEAAFFRAIAASGARSLLIGRRALIVIGIPVLTADYDLWIASEDAEALNAALADLGMIPNREPADARRVGRYVLENGERVDVLLARQVSTVDAVHVFFDDVYARSRSIDVARGASIRVPSIEDLILTKRFALRAKDVADIRLLEARLAQERGRK